MKNQVTVEKLNLSFKCSVEKNTSGHFVSRSFLLVEASQFRKSLKLIYNYFLKNTKK